MIKIAAIGIVTILLAVLGRSFKSEYGTYIAIAGSLLLILLGVSRFSGIVDVIYKIYSGITINNLYITILLKMLGIAFVAEFTSSICKDAGYSAIASLVELIGKLSILLTSAPILEALFDTVFSAGILQ